MRSIQVRVVTFLMFVIACSGAKEEGVELTIKGKVLRQVPGTIILTEMIDPASKPAGYKPFETTIELRSDKTFEKKVRVTEPGYYQLNVFKRQFVTVILDKSDVDITVDGADGMGLVEIKGSPDQELVNQVQKIVQQVQNSDEVHQMEAEFQVAVSQNNETKIREIQQHYAALLDKGNEQVAALLNNQPPSLGLINILQKSNALDKDKFFSVYTAAAEKFKSEWPNNYYAKEFVKFVDVMKKTAIGQPAPEISMPDPNGKVLTLSSFKGKFVLVDFWAKWCGPCRKENPNVVKAYHQFKNKPFDILGVSLDRTHEDWVKAIEEDGLTWNHVSDLKYFDSQAAKDYNINGIPFSILVDPNGIIIAKNLRGPDLQKKLSEVLN